MNQIKNLYIKNVGYAFDGAYPEVLYFRDRHSWTPLPNLHREQAPQPVALSAKNAYRDEQRSAYAIRCRQVHTQYIKI